MRALPVALAALGVALGVAGIALAAIPISILGFGVMVVAGFLHTVRSVRATNDANMGDELSPESRTLLRPLRKLHQEMHALGSGPEVSPYLAKEARDEADRLLRESAAALALRDRLVRQRFGRHDAEKGMAELEARLASASSEDECATLRSALDARTTELGHYSQLEAGVGRIESSLRQAEASLAELKTRLSVGASGALAEQNEDELRRAVGRTKALSESLQEVQELTQANRD